MSETFTNIMYFSGENRKPILTGRKLIICSAPVNYGFLFSFAVTSVANLLVLPFSLDDGNFDDTSSAERAAVFHDLDTYLDAQLMNINFLDLPDQNWVSGVHTIFCEAPKAKSLDIPQHH